MLKQAHDTLEAILADEPAALATRLRHVLNHDAVTRSHAVSIGIGILLPDGKHLLRGRQLKASDADSGWVDLTAENMSRWQQRLKAMQTELSQESADTSSFYDRNFSDSRHWLTDSSPLDIGEAVAWVFNNEDQGQRGKN